MPVDDLFDAWQQGPFELDNLTRSEQVFAYDAPAPEAPVTWRFDADKMAAADPVALARPRQEIRRNQTALAETRERVDDLALKLSNPAYTYGAPGVVAEDELEIEVLNLLEPGRQGFEYGPLDGLRERVEQEIEAFFKKIRRMLAHYQQVETRAGSSLRALTQLDWDGDVRTVTYSPSEADRELHTYNVNLAVETSDESVRTAMEILAQAAKLVAAAGTGNFLAALSAVWHLFQQVRDKIQLLPF